jgi:hypothetical protein
MALALVSVNINIVLIWPSSTCKHHSAFVPQSTILATAQRKCASNFMKDSTMSSVTSCIAAVERSLHKHTAEFMTQC